jgi:hypothetical protein
MVGLIIDARGRPLALPSDDATRMRKIAEWMTAMGVPVATGS